MAYDWPGNVRELERLMERAVTLADADVIELDDLPLDVRGDYAAALGPSLRRNDSLRAWASRYARLVLDRCEATSAKRAGPRHQLSHAAVVPALPGSRPGEPRLTDDWGAEAWPTKRSLTRSAWRWSRRCDEVAARSRARAGCLRRTWETRQGGESPRGRAFSSCVRVRRGHDENVVGVSWLYALVAGAVGVARSGVVVRAAAAQIRPVQIVPGGTETGR